MSDTDRDPPDGASIPRDPYVIPYAEHPGDHIKDAIEGRGITAYRLAQLCKIPQGRISEIMKGERAISADTALRFAKVFGTTPGFFFGLQVAYDLWSAYQSAQAELDGLEPLPPVADPG